MSAARKSSSLFGPTNIRRVFAPVLPPSGGIMCPKQSWKEGTKERTDRHQCVWPIFRREEKEREEGRGKIVAKHNVVIHIHNKRPPFCLLLLPRRRRAIFKSGHKKRVSELLLLLPSDERSCFFLRWVDGSKGSDERRKGSASPLQILKRQKKEEKRHL